MFILDESYAGAFGMEVSSFKKAVCLIFLSGLLLIDAGCTTTELWWKGKPISKMTPAELEEQDPELWSMWKHMHEDRL